jgi:tetratricopeptide (TPR) repeat protein
VALRRSEDQSSSYTARGVKKSNKARRPRETPAPKAAHVWSQHGRRLLLLWAVVLVAYSNSFHAAILFDDVGVLLQDPRIRETTVHNVGSILAEGYWHINPGSGLYRPITTLSYLVNYAVFDNGPRPAGYHWVNFALHGVNVTLVYALGVLIFAEPSLALALAAVWGLHPVLTESVTNIVGRADLLAAFGVLAGLLCYARSTSVIGQRRWWWLAAMVAAQSIGLFSKENAAVLPGILLLYDLTWSERATWRARAPAYAALALPFAAFFYLRSQLHAHMVVVFPENPLVSAGFWTARLTAIKVIGKFLWLFLWPARLSPDYSYNAFPLFGWKLANWEDEKALIALAVLLGAIGLAVRWRRSWKTMFFFVLFFFVALMPTANLVMIIGSIMAERFMYLPSVGLAGCLVAAIHALGRRLSSVWPASPRAAWIAIGFACLAFGLRTYARNFDWHDDLSLWTSAVDAYPGSARPHMNLGNTLAKIPGRTPDAIAELKTALRISPDSGQAHYNLGSVLAQVPGRLPDAIAEYREVLRTQPDSALAHNNLGNAFARTPGRQADAMAEWRAAIRSDPDFAEAHYNLGNALSEMPGHLPDTIAEYQAAIRSQPDLAQAHNNLANALAQTPDRLPEAIEEWRAAIRIQPGLVQAHVNLGTALARMPGQLANAIGELEFAQRIQPNPQVKQMLDRLRNGQQ